MKEPIRSGESRISPSRSAETTRGVAAGVAATVHLIIAEASRFPDVASKQWASQRYLLAPLSGYLRQQAEKGTFCINDPQTAAVQLTTLASGDLRPLPAKPLDQAEQESWTRSVLKLRVKGWRNPASNSQP